MVSSSFLVCLFLFLHCLCTGFAIHVSHDGRAITIDGQRRILISGSIHYTRSTAQMWPDLIKKAKEGGVDAIETYVFWNAHEPARRQYDFSNNLDLIRFLKTIQDQGLYAVLRIGPYVCAEWNYGGFPVWLHNIPGIQLRTANALYMNEMQNFTTMIVDMVKQANLFASQGGPIILAQIENEYGNIMSSYGDAGKAYVEWCASMATSLDIGVPWIMCQQPDAPQPIINTCNGWYCDQFTPNNPNSPKMWTENWTGWFKNWGGLDPKRTAEDIAFAVARFFQLGGTFQNYYMYHGGTNFGRTAGGPYITTSYDYDAPLDEYGNLNQPKYGHLKVLHDVLHSIENTLTNGNVSHIDFNNYLSATVYTTNEKESCFFGNANETTDATVTFGGIDYDIPAWSVSILPDCKNVAYNTAKVNTQTWVMVKRTNEAEKEAVALKWLWRSESIGDTVVKGMGQKSASKLLDQKVDNDMSDYMWYMTSVNLDKEDLIWRGRENMSLRINGTGQVLHVFLNGEYLGRKYATYGKFNSVFEKNVNFSHGPNQISLLSVTVGLQNYGADFDVKENGIVGPVEIIAKTGEEIIIKDLSTHKWSYKVGLNGIDENKLFKVGSADSSKWQAEDVPIQEKMTWYKTTFKAPLGNDPVALDLEGMGKGQAWVNGNNIGRFWPEFTAKQDGCSTKACDYRGPYHETKCVYNCGKPTQKWYHVPRSFLVDGENELVLFEEFGGNPCLVKFQTVSIGTACGHAHENQTMEISCQGRRLISGIRFASFGNVRGSCGSFEKGSCQDKNDAFSIIQKECIGKEKCRVAATEAIFGSMNCQDDHKKKLVVEAVC